MKITEALCNVITEAGGTPTTADADSVTHALGTLYTTLGGTDTLPDDVADRINSLSDHIGGGGSANINTGTVQIRNSTSAAVSAYQFKVKDVGGQLYATSSTFVLTAGATKEMSVTKNGTSAGGASDTPYCSYWAAPMMIAKGIDPTKLVASASLGSVSLYREESLDSTKNYGFILFIKATGAEITEQPLITLSISA